MRRQQRFFFSKTHFLICWALSSYSVSAQPFLQNAQGLQYQWTLENPQVAAEKASFVLGDRIEGVANERVKAQGNAQFRREDIVIKADSIEHDAATHLIDARGHVQIFQAGNVLKGPSLVLGLEDSTGVINSPEYQLLQGGQGQASLMELKGKGLAVAHDVEHSTCDRPPAGKWLPDWMLSASRITFDRQADTGTAHNVMLTFKGVPLLASPWLDFPLSDRRRTGLLPPTFNIASDSGFELTLPYYVNADPQFDFTFYPTVMTQRGLDLGLETRYLFPSIAGQARMAYMPSDPLRHQDRWGVALQQQWRINETRPDMVLDMRMNKVSDDNYWRDFPRSITALTSRLLSNDMVLAFSAWGGKGTLGAYTYQTLQQPDTIVKPYDRVPHFQWVGTMPLKGVRAPLAIETQVTQFRADRAQAQNGWRSVVAMQWEPSYDYSFIYIRPSVRVHARSYALDQALMTGDYAQKKFAQFIIPTYSLDAGLFFERQDSERYSQTLEPRALLSWTPFKNQQGLPNYDSGDVDFNMASIFSAWPIAGNDRIADMKALTLGATSRWLDNRSGHELWAVGLAQRLRLSDQQVQSTDATTPLTASWSDILLEGRVSIADRWNASSVVQIDQENKTVRRSTNALRYTPSAYRSFSVGYTLQRDVSRLAYAAWQWPLNDLWGDKGRYLGEGKGLGSSRWYSVGRLNYSVMDKKITDMLMGFEYDGGCWLGRIVIERLQTSTSSANQRILFQLELNGFSRIGTNPLSLLQNNIPRYQHLRQEVAPPNRFINYE